MKRNKNSPGASIRNTESISLNKGKWFEQKGKHGLHYNAVYEKLDELSCKYTPFQIVEIMELGVEQYKKE